METKTHRITGPAKPVQERTLKTRAKLMEAARDIIDVHGLENLRVEDVVARAGVAKGTFFAHFRDKDALFERLIGDDIDTHLDLVEILEPPRNIADVVAALMPMVEYMAASRLRFDIILRYSGAGEAETIGPIMMTFGRREHILTRWLAGGPFRSDVPAKLLAEGVDAFVIQSIALHLCAISAAECALRDRLSAYLRAWLIPQF